MLVICRVLLSNILGYLSEHKGDKDSPKEHLKDGDNFLAESVWNDVSIHDRTHEANADDVDICIELPYTHLIG